MKSYSEHVARVPGKY